MSVEPDPDFARKAQALAGLKMAISSVNAAAAYYAQVWGRWPRFNESVARILQDPLTALEVDQLLDVTTLEIVPGHE